MIIVIVVGVMVMFYVNDMGFWIVNCYFDIFVKDMFVFWMCMVILIGFIGFFFVLMFGLFV